MLNKQKIRWKQKTEVIAEDNLCRPCHPRGISSFIWPTTQNAHFSKRLANSFCLHACICDITKKTWSLSDYRWDKGIPSNVEVTPNNLPEGLLVRFPNPLAFVYPHIEASPPTHPRSFHSSCTHSKPYHSLIIHTTSDKKLKAPGGHKVRAKLLIKVFHHWTFLHWSFHLKNWRQNYHMLHKKDCHGPCEIFQKSLSQIIENIYWFCPMSCRIYVWGVTWVVL